MIPVRKLATTYGVGNGPIHLDDLDCIGSEENLLECSADQRGDHDCTHEEDAGVKCGGKLAHHQYYSDKSDIHYFSAMCEEYSARIVRGDEDIYYNSESIDIAFFINDHLAVGRVELCKDGNWSAVCGNVWTREDASVACKQLGFSGAGIKFIASMLLPA